MKKKSLYLFMAMLICLQMTGCGSGKDQMQQDDLSQQSENTRNSYIAEEIILPHEAIFYETVHDNTLYYINYLPSAKGAVQPEQSAVCMLDLEQEEAEPVEIPFIPENGQTVGGMAVDEEGAAHIVSCQYAGTGAEITDVFLTTVERDGTIANSYSIGEVFEEKEFMYVSAFEIDGEGNAYLGANETIYVIDRNGSLVFKIVCKGYLVRLCKDNSGKVYAVWSEGGTEMIAEVDVKAQSLGTGQELPEMTNIIGAGAGAEGKLVLATESGVYDYDMVRNTLTERFQWFPLDIAINQFDQVFPLTDGRILWVGRAGDQWGSGKTSLWMVRERTEADKVSEQSQPQDGTQAEPESGTGDVILGVAWLDPAVKQAVVDFNQSNPDSRIEVREYGEGDYEAGAVQLNMDIISGNCPDILILPYQFPIDVYAAKGVLEDLNSYIDTDDTLRRTDLQENILKAYETNGKLFAIPVTFMVESILGKASVLENRTGWNLDEMIAFSDSLDDENLIFPDPSKASVMDICLKANRDCIVDWTADEGIGFNRDFFIRMLEFSNRFMEEEYSDEITLKRIMDGEVLLMPTGGTPTIYQHNPLGEVAYIGYPSENGSGSLATSSTTVAISIGCKAKGTAWNFIKSLLSEEVQESSLLEGYPIRKNSLEKYMEQSKEAGGGVVIGDASGNVIDAYEQRGATEDEIREFQALIDSVEKIVVGDDEISKIIKEEAGAYFSGDKTVEEVADIVENRIGIYVNEMK